jgi:hypothetical protein
MAGKSRGNHGYTNERVVWGYLYKRPNSTPREMMVETGLTFWQVIGCIRRLEKKGLVEGKGNTWQRTFTALGAPPNDGRGWSLNSRKSILSHPGGKKAKPKVPAPATALEQCWGFGVIALTGDSDLTDQNELATLVGGEVRPEEMGAASD